MKKFLRFSLIGTAVSAIIYFGAALIMTFLPAPTFTTDPFPVAERAAADFIPQQFTMRDGETLFARQFPAESDTTILLLHGVTSESAAFNASAQMLRQTSGAEVVALDLRGHGQSGGTVGDVDYIGQYEDDVADVITLIQNERPNGRIILAGHSMGGRYRSAVCPPSGNQCAHHACTKPRNGRVRRRLFPTAHSTSDWVDHAQSSRH